MGVYDDSQLQAAESMAKTRLFIVIHIWRTERVHQADRLDEQYVVLDAKKTPESLDLPCDEDVTETAIMGLPWRLGLSAT
jgi:hypothetical protein